MSSIPKTEALKLIQTVVSWRLLWSNSYLWHQFNEAAATKKWRKQTDD